MTTQIGVAVCGSGYGSVYARIVSRLFEVFRIEAVLGRGSERSRMLAEELSVPFVHEVSELPSSTQIAVVAIPSNAQKTVIEQLLRRDISVLCEYPVSAELLPLISNKDMRLMVNSHLSLLPSVQKFLEYFDQACNTSKLQSITVITSERSLSSILHILTCMLGRVELSCKCLIRSCTGSAVLTSSGIPINLSWSRRSVDSKGLYDSVRAVQITAIFDTGSLLLTSEFGAVVWSTSYGYASAGSVDTLHEVKYGGVTKASEFVKYRALANRQALMAVRDMNECEGIKQRVRFEYLRNVIEVNDQLKSAQLVNSISEFK